MKTDIFHAYIALLKQTRPAAVGAGDTMEEETGSVDKNVYLSLIINETFVCLFPNISNSITHRESKTIVRTLWYI